MTTMRPQWVSTAAEVPTGLPEALDSLALSLNENPFPPLPTVLAALVKSMHHANRYPEFLPERLRALIARRIGVADEQIVPGAGATGVALQVLHAVTAPGDRIVLASPTFDGYPILARMGRLDPVTVPLDEHGHHDLAAMGEAAVDAAVVVVCRPHNPTGTIESQAAMEDFLSRLPADTVVLLDEAYIEFVATEHRIDAADLVRRYPKVVVLRTFSKAYGLAALRIGYGMCSPEIADQLWSMQLPFGISSTSAVAVAASYEAKGELRQRIQSIVNERRYLHRRLLAAGVYNVEGHANFVYLPAGARPWRDVFTHPGPRVRHYPDGAVRITVGGPASTRAVQAALGRSPRDQPVITPSGMSVETSKRDCE